ncbi:MAG: hypothetical protein Q9195_008170 [Heterodermia aff. obscurata]
MDETQQGPSLFEALPLEIRLQIYGYLLPYSVTSSAPKPHGKEITVWRAGNITILATNRQIHEEAAAVMYGDSWFWFSIDDNRISFKFYCRQRDYMPKDCRHIDVEEFFKDIGPRNVSRISHLRVCIRGPIQFAWGMYQERQIPSTNARAGTSATDFKGPIKYLATPKGYQEFMNDIADQVSKFPKLVESIPQIHDLRATVWIERKEPDASFDYALAKPLLELNSGRKMLLAGDIDTNTVQELWYVLYDHTSNPKANSARSSEKDGAPAVEPNLKIPRAYLRDARLL